MKKVIALLMLTATIALAQNVTTIPTRYVSKSVPTRYGVDATCWVVTNLGVQVSSNPSATIKLIGFLDVDAFQSGKPALERKTIYVDAVEDLTTTSDIPTGSKLYETVAGYVYVLVLSHEDFVGGTVVTVGD